MTPDLPPDTKHLDPLSIRLSRDPAGILILTVENDSYPHVRILRAFPLSDPRHYLGFFDQKGKEIGLLVNPRRLDGSSRALLERELDRRYFVPVILRIHAIREEFGSLYWQVDTDRGPRSFVLRSPAESILQLSPKRLMISDVEGNRFEIPDLSQLDPRSVRWLDKIWG